MSSSFKELLARTETDPNVLGVILTGSQARELATARSDTDVYVIVRDGGRWATSRTPGLDTIVMSLADLADVSDRWQRYAYRGARVLLDRNESQIAELVNAQAALTDAESDAWSREYLDGYINLIYRATKSRRDGYEDVARLDEMEAAPWFLWTLFALYGRVRPYNKYLRWELETHPLPSPWTAGYLMAALTGRPTALFGDLEVVARAKGYGDVLDAWDDLDLFTDQDRRPTS